jgi:hypothetical protein
LATKSEFSSSAITIDIDLLDSSAFVIEREKVRLENSIVERKFFKNNYLKVGISARGA